MDRKQILAKAEQCICRDRQDSYGSPENNFSVIADYWNVYLNGRIEPALDAEDVAILMALMKFGRITSGKVNMDNYIDAIGYVACAGEIASKGE